MMVIITQESLATHLVKLILKDLWQEYECDLLAHETCQSFDAWVWERAGELGQYTYDAIGQLYGGLDEAVQTYNEV